MIKLLKRPLSISSAPQANDKLNKVFSQLPWDFNAHPFEKEVKSLEAPVDLGKNILNSTQATSLFKDFVCGIYENDFSEVETKMEPLMLS